jgi:tetratricopeptide (TPR) repeat protein
MMDRLTEAESLVRRALAILEANYGPDHPDIARELANLATLLCAMNRLAEAEPLARRALAIPPESHPQVASRLTVLVNILRNSNRSAEAESLALMALGIYEASYGPYHPGGGEIPF